MSQKQKTIYYQDELNDEFAGDHIEAKKIDGAYRYIRTSVGAKLTHVFWYHVIAIPLAKAYMRVHFHHRIENKDVLKKAGGRGFYMYGNHTHPLGDAVIPTLVNRPVDVATIVHPNNVSMPFLGRITPSLGALPLPDDREAMKHFLEALDSRLAKKECIMIYPEAHIWPYYTKIRPFRDSSFRYPVQAHAPVYCLTNTYQKGKNSRVPQIVTYVDGPFYANEELPAKEQKRMLRDRVYNTMCERAKNNTVELIHYEKRGLGEQL